MEQFYTIQGEGLHRGKAAYFIRLGGCEVGCVWCDVKESWEAGHHPMKTVDEILVGVKESPSSLVVITGGEPTMYDLRELTGRLKDMGKTVNLETSGAYPLLGQFDWICLSPKKFKAPLPENLPLAQELKVVIFNKTDFEWAEEHLRQTAAQCYAFLQPEWSRKEEMLPYLVDYAKKHPRWAISLQEHKYMNVP